MFSYIDHLGYAPFMQPAGMHSHLSHYILFKKKIVFSICCISICNCKICRHYFVCLFVCLFV